MSNYDAPGAYPPPPQQRLGAGMAITALVLGIIALLFCWTVVGGILFGLIAIVLGIIASGRAKRGVARGRGMAITGAVLGLIGLVLSGALIAFGLSIFNSDSGKTYQSCIKDAGSDQAKVQKCAQDFSKNLQNG